MTLIASPAAPPITPAEALDDLRAIFPSGTLAPFYPDIPLVRLELSAPFAVYSPPIIGLRKSEILHAAELNRWRTMLIDRGAVVAWASLRPGDGERLHVVEVNVSPWIDRVVSAISAAESEERVNAATYELRFVESRPHGFFALWLVPTGGDGGDQVIPISEHASLERGSMYSIAQVTEAFVSSADDGDGDSCATFT